MVARKLELKIRDQLVSGGASANLRLAGGAYPPGGGLFKEALGVGDLDRPGGYFFGWRRPIASILDNH
jgi:hypothetical protein